MNKLDPELLNSRQKTTNLLVFPCAVFCSTCLWVSALTMVATSFGLNQEAGSIPLLIFSITGGVAVPLTLLAYYRERLKRSEMRLLEALATTDSLTGLFNRRAFQLSIEHLQKRLEGGQFASALILFDLDHFKSVNDNHGHLAGDHVLKDVSALTKSALRNPEDKIARWGGEEFIVYLPDCSVETASLVAERIRRSIEDHICKSGDLEIRVSASFGVTMMAPLASFEENIARVDEALYQAKHRGRNRVEFSKVRLIA
ncbi:MAG: diguanylate cyclase [Pseudomonadota bacterium]